jgi:hypothetical protein
VVGADELSCLWFVCLLVHEHWQPLLVDSLLCVCLWVWFLDEHDVVDVDEEVGVFLSAPTSDGVLVAVAAEEVVVAISGTTTSGNACDACDDWEEVDAFTGMVTSGVVLDADAAEEEVVELLSSTTFASVACASVVDADEDDAVVAESACTWCLWEQDAFEHEHECLVGSGMAVLRPLTA